MVSGQPPRISDPDIKKEGRRFGHVFVGGFCSLGITICFRQKVFTQ